MIAIPIPTDTPDVTLRVTLSGADYLLRLVWSEREARWYLSLADTDGVAIVDGCKVLANRPLLRLIADDRRPLAGLYAIDTTGLGEPPAYAWGDRWLLVYDG